MGAQIALRHLAQAGEDHVDRRGDGAQQEEAARTGQENDDDRDDDGRHDDAFIDGGAVIVRLARTGDAALLVLGDQIGKGLILFQRGTIEVHERLFGLSFGEQRIHILVRGAVFRPCLALVLQDGAVFRRSVLRRVDDVGERLLVPGKGVICLFLQRCQRALDLRTLRGILCDGTDDGNPALCACGIRDIRHGRQIVRPAHQVHNVSVQLVSRMAGVHAKAEEHHDEHDETHDDLFRYGDSVHFFSFPSFPSAAHPKTGGRSPLTLPASSLPMIAEMPASGAKAGSPPAS